MYEIYAYPYGNPDAKLLLYRPNDPQAMVLSPKLTREVSKGGSLVFTMTRDHAQYDMLQKLSTVVQVRRDGKEIWRGRVLKHEADFYNRRVVYCEGSLSYFNDSSITPFNYKGTLRQFLQHLIDAHNDQVKSKMKCFHLGTVTAALGDLVVQFGDADQYGVGEDYGKVWDILDKLVLKVFGGYFYCSFDSSTGLNVLNYCDQAVEAKRQTAQKIEYGRNLLNLSETTDATDLYTRIYPIGNKHTVDTSKWYYKLMWWRDTSKDKHEERWGIMETDAATVAQYLPASGYSYNLEEGWIQNDAAVQKFGIITRIVELDTDSANDTFAAGVQALQQNYAMKTSYVIRAVDLVDAGYDTDRLDFAMYSHIVSTPHSVDAVMLCTKLVEPLEKPARKEFTFGMTRRTLTDRQVANMGTTNLLQESAYTSEKYHQDMLKRLFAYQSSTDSKLADISKGLSDAVVKMGDLQDQIDDNITSWFFPGVPTAENEPAASWKTDTAKKQHIGDLYYDKLTGMGYRWVLDNGTYSWVVIRDTGVAKALADAAAAQATANGKVRCFGATPAPPYDIGDIWMQGTGGDIMLCQVSRPEGAAYNAADWVRASKYTDDTAANAAQNTANQAKQDANEAAKTATNFLEYTPQNGLIVRHYSMPGKQVQITNDGVKVMNGDSSVTINANGISITDGIGSCNISSGAISFYGIRNAEIAMQGYIAAQSLAPTGDYVEYPINAQGCSYVMLMYDSYTTKTSYNWIHSTSSTVRAGSSSVILPVNGQIMTMTFPWDTMHRRDVAVFSDRIRFYKGYRRKLIYRMIAYGEGYIDLAFGPDYEMDSSDVTTQVTDEWVEAPQVCVPSHLYAFM